MSRKICIEYGLGICAEVQAQQESGREAEGAGAVWEVVDEGKKDLRFGDNEDEGGQVN